MRNPLFNTEARPDKDLQALAPVPERYAGQNNPYRGIEQHGVESPLDPMDTPGYGDTVAVELDPAQPRQEPVPVYITNRDARERRDWSVQKWPLNAALSTRAVQIAGVDERRISLLIRNDGPDAIFLNKNPEGATPAFGWELPSGEREEIDAQTEVWANVDITDGDDTANVYTLSVYAETLPNR